METSDWFIWAFLLFLQNAAHTATSRSRNSKSLVYNAVASTFSNGIWFASQFYIVNMLVQTKNSMTQFIFMMIFYVALTAAGSVASQWYLMRFEQQRGIERG